MNWSYWSFKMFYFCSVCFKVFDIDRDGVLSRTELEEMVLALLEVWKDNRTDAIPVRALVTYVISATVSQYSKVDIAL